MIYAQTLAAYLAIGAVLFVVLLWSYIMVMGVKRCRDRGTLTPLVYNLSKPVLVIGVFADVLLNQFYFAFVCMDFTHLGTVTSRMKGYKYREGTAWQKRVSAWVEHHIDDFEDTPEGHI